MLIENAFEKGLGIVWHRLGIAWKPFGIVWEKLGKLGIGWERFETLGNDEGNYEIHEEQESRA